MVNVISAVTDKRRHDPANVPLSLGSLIPTTEPKPFMDAEVNLEGYLAGLPKKNYLGRNNRGQYTGADTNPAGADDEDDFEF